ncbi:DNA recombination protein RmuC [Methyloceanibacter sp.]|uniref:DNA recombination protein RmuC n=1 Tax=Methyloceanibacter sp. TaxID=1965321 RepID=UPI002D4FDFF4|nr:DNA recombination protein RmuC [Methyloceanibacter sp.]HZP08731.1 DNA recombination protein RmuC [Methyloceanibacter sp.]
MALAPIQIGSVTLDPVLALLALAGLAVLALLALAVTLIVHMKGRRREVEAQAAELAELKGRLQTFAEISVARQGDIARAVNERLDRMTHRVGSDLNETARKTNDSIAKLHERLAVIDNAQKNLTDLSTNMVSLKEILANKQARGAFGQMRMESIIIDGLPKGAYTFQATLSNGKRPDCLLHMPNTRAGVVIDAKFPLEGFEAFRTARREEERKEAARRVRNDVARHIEAMAERYFLPGETQDTAILFVPSESVYADLAEHFDDLVQKAHRSRIVITSPNMLMLAVQTMQAILKDVKMREQAHLIQREVVHLMEDTVRLRERVLDLQRHFGQANADIEKILTSSEKVTARGRKIEALEFEEAAQAAEIEHEGANGAVAPSPSPTRREGDLRARQTGERGSGGAPSPGASALGADAPPSPQRGEGNQRRTGGPRIVRQPDLLAGE